MKILKLTQNDKKVQFDDSFEVQITYEDMVIRYLKEFHLKQGNLVHFQLLALVAV